MDRPGYLESRRTFVFGKNRARDVRPENSKSCAAAFGGLIERILLAFRRFLRSKGDGSA
jgi:hypothetical protein